MKHLISLLSLFTVIYSSHARSPRIVHEKRGFLPNGWSPLESPVKRDSNPSHFRIALKQSNVDYLEEYLMDVAHPDSPNYGKVWTAGRLKETFAPSDETVSAVKEWLMEHGLEKEHFKLSKDQAWLDVMMTIKTAELLLDAKYEHFRNEESGKVQLACDSYSLPEHVAKHVDFISPGIVLHPSMNKRRSVSGGKTSSIRPHVHASTELIDDVSPTSLDNCSHAITPACLRELYGFHYQFKHSVPNAYTITELTPATLLNSDLDMFFKTFSPDLVGKRPIESDVDGGLQQMVDVSLDNTVESALDFEYGMLFVAPQTVQLLQIGDLVEGGSFNNLLDSLDQSYCTFEGGDDPNLDGIYPDNRPGGFNESESCGTVKAIAISTSYGQSESFLSEKYYQRQCNEFGKLSLAGMTFLFSAGDFGVGGFEGCLDETGQPSPNGTQFSPQAPASCAFVTSVGATMLIPGSSIYEPETAINFTSGGFSNLISRPSYQDEAVSTYLHQFVPADTRGHFNTTGRGFPDISLNGRNFTTVFDGETRLVSGTSAASPVFGAMITAINDARMKIKKGPVGFINYALYSKKFQDAFNDITSGSNPNCGTSGFVALGSSYGARNAQISQVARAIPKSALMTRSIFDYIRGHTPAEQDLTKLKSVNAAEM